jgi:hypothetical protein
MRHICHTILAFIAILFFASTLSAQRDKGKEYLDKAFQQKDASKKNEMIQKAVQAFQKGGMKREMNIILGDAFMDHQDLPTAARYYGLADKADKAEGLAKVAQAYADVAFEDEKMEAKNLKSAVGFYTKAGKMKEGGAYIGDKYFDKGDKFYLKAVDYYLMGSDTPSAAKVARELERKGGESANTAVDIYKRIGMFKKAGDMAYDMHQYTKAYDNYSSGEVTEGLRKCADVFYSLGMETEAQNIYVKMVENYAKTANTEAIEKLATENVNLMNYGLAARIYDKAGNLNKARKYYAYYKIMSLDLDSAKLLLKANEENDLVKAIDANAKYLNPLKEIKSQFDDWVKQQPYVATELDPETNKYRPTPKDEQILVDYYKAIKDPIVESCMGISKSVSPITNAELKKMIKKKFLDYPAVGKILDASTFSVKLSKASAQVKDVYLKKL